MSGHLVWAALALAISRGFLCLCVTGIGMSISGSISNSHYLQSGPSDLFPTCIAILYNSDDTGIAVEFGKYGGGQVGGDVTIMTPSATLEVREHKLRDRLDEEVRLREARCIGRGAHCGGWIRADQSIVNKFTEFWDFGECKISIFPLLWERDSNEGDEDSMVFNILNAQSGEPLPIPCMQEDHLVYYKQDGLSTWAITFCLVVWCGMRFLGFFIEFLVVNGLNAAESGCRKALFNFTKFVLFSWMMSIISEPIMSLSVSELCPQLVAMTYPGEIFALVAVGSFLLFLDLCLLAGMVNSGDEESRTKAASSVGGIFMFSYFLAKELQEKAKADPGNKDNWTILSLIAMAVPVLPIGAVLLSVLWKILTAAVSGITVFLGLQMNLAIRFPEFDLSAKINAFHVLSFMVWLLDILDLLKGFLKPSQGRQA